MIKIEKDLNDVPTVLNSVNRKEAFEKNIDSCAYLYGKGLYKSKSVQEKLNEIYHYKCAYCERDISDDDKHIEHYRPKSRYYWLAYSWDNLLLCCSRCNKAKGDKFQTIHCSMLYGNEPFSEIHILGKQYDIQELPKSINPEREDILDEIIFDRDAKMTSLNKRLVYTIDELCSLNRNELVEKRIKILNGFIRRVERHYVIYLEKKNYRDYSMFEPDIEEFISKFRRKNEFYAFRYFIIHHIEIFFENRILQSIIKHKVEEYLK
jgi:uncharacterized protein (TIGR02646 family)